MLQACDAAGVPYGTATTWKWAGEGKTWGYKATKKYLSAARKFSEGLKRAAEISQERRLDRALRTVEIAASEGFKETLVKEITEGFIDGAGQRTVDKFKETRQVKQGVPQWTAAAWLLERCRPEVYGQKNQLHITGSSLELRPGEAEQVVSEATDEEMRAIDSGDIKALTKVVARIRQKGEGS